MLNARALAITALPLGGLMAGIALVLLAGPRASPAQTLETRIAPVAMGDATVATVADFAWLVGAWEGQMASGIGTAYVVYAAPHAGLMTGVMHLVSQDDKILVVELITLVDTARGVELRFRHFSPKLAAYETDFQQSMLLTSHEASVDVFENQVPYSKGLMSTQARVTKLLRQPDGSFIGKSDIIGDNGQRSVIEATYRRARPAN